MVVEDEVDAAMDETEGNSQKKGVEEGRYGPWMLVNDRKHKQRMARTKRRDSNNQQEDKGKGSINKFVVLHDTHEGSEEPIPQDGGSMDPRNGQEERAETEQSTGKSSISKPSIANQTFSFSMQDFNSLIETPVMLDKDLRRAASLHAKMKENLGKNKKHIGGTLNDPGNNSEQGKKKMEFDRLLGYDGMEKLSREIQREVENGHWKHIHASRGGLGVSHLFFADDLMLFSEASEQQITIIMNCLKGFSARSGLNINLSKSSIFCSPNTNNRLRRRLGEMFGIPVTNNLGKYLGVPILQKRVSRRSFDYIMEGMHNKLSNWKMGTLSLAGRRVLVQSSLATMPVYTM